MLIAFATEDEALQAIRQRLWIGAISVRVEKAKDKEPRNPRKTLPSTQC